MSHYNKWKTVITDHCRCRCGRGSRGGRSGRRTRSRHKPRDSLSATSYNTMQQAPCKSTTNNDEIMCYAHETTETT